MVNKPLLPPWRIPANHLSHSDFDVFPTGTAFAKWMANRGLGELVVRTIRNRAWESSERIN
jgi:hypothetical protein